MSDEKPGRPWPEMLALIALVVLAVLASEYLPDVLRAP